MEQMQPQDFGANAPVAPPTSPTSAGRPQPAPGEALATPQTLRRDPQMVPEGGMGLSQERDLVVNMGPQHPSTHGVLRLIVRLNGETVVDVRPDVGYLHRCFEKLAESKTWPQVITFTDRIDYLAAMNNEWCFCMAAEKLLSLEIPERAQYMRVVVGELQRIASHLLWFGTFCLDVGATTAFLYAFREREAIYDLFEYISGARLLYNYYRIGGLRNDFPPGWPERALEMCDYLERKALPEYDNLVTKNKIFQVRTRGVGPLAARDAIAWGASGPMLRASGVKWDLRRADPYSIYDQFDFDIPVGKDPGDVFDRYLVRMAEMRESIKIIRQAVKQLPDGDFMAPKLPKVIKPPPGEVYQHTEHPRGETACWVVSDGGPKPYRVYWRSAGFVHLQLMNVMAPGFKVADLVAILGALDIVLGDVDR